MVYFVTAKSQEKKSKSTTNVIEISSSLADDFLPICSLFVFQLAVSGGVLRGRCIAAECHGGEDGGRGGHTDSHVAAVVRVAVRAGRRHGVGEAQGD